MYKTKFIFSEDYKKLGLKIGFLDAGAREDLPDPWKFLSEELLDIIGFEPDLVECERLIKSYPKRKYFANALWSEKTQVPIHINKVASTSSVFPTNNQLATCFDPVHFDGRKTEKVFQVNAVKLDEVLDSEWKLDFFKIDTQGAEKMILEGAKKTIASSKPIIIAEAWNVDAYLGAPPASSIISLMESLGYFVLDMEITASWLYKNSARSWLSSKARATGVDLVFFPRLSELSGMQDDVLIKRAAILELFGYRDLSVCLMESFFQGSVEKRNAILEQFFKNAQSESSLVEKVQRKLSVLLGKKRSIHAPIHD